MHRTTVYLEPDVLVMLEREGRRRGQPMAGLIREAIRDFLTREPQTGPPGAGAFDSGQSGTASDVDRVLKESGFGESR